MNLLVRRASRVFGAGANDDGPMAVVILAMCALAWHASTKVLDLQDRLNTSLRQAGLQLADRRFIAATAALRERPWRRGRPFGVTSSRLPSLLNCSTRVPFQ